MSTAKQGKSKRPRKAFLRNELNEVMPFRFESDTWIALTSHFPNKLSDKSDMKLRGEIEEWCNSLAMMRNAIQGGAALARTVRLEDNKPALADQLAMSLRKAVKAAKAILATGADGNSDPATEILEKYEFLWNIDGLEAMAQKAECARDELRARGKPQTIKEPWGEFVRGVAQCFRVAELDTPVNGRGYEELSNSPSWFQKCMIELNASLPEELKEPTSKDPALAKKIMRAMRVAK